MIDKLSKKYNVILGLFIGFILYQFVMQEGYAILVGIEQRKGAIDIQVNSKGLLFFQCAAIAAFIITVCIFCSKKFRNINFDKISVYIILTLILSIIITFELIVMIVASVHKFYPNLFEAIGNNYFVSINLAFIMIILGVIIFLITFILFINRKVKYIKFLTKEVKNIKEEGFGKTIKVKGEDELAELCKSINDMSVQLAQKIENEKKLENTKSELITNISHDLKTPLTSIVGYLEVLNNIEVDSEVRQKYIGIAYNKGLRLKNLVNELFEYTKITSHDFKIKRERYNISNFINQMVGESILEFEVKNIEVILDNPYKELYKEIDIRLFSRAIENIIKNAEKYTDNDGIFKVEVKKEKEDILIIFSNTCKYIEDDLLDNVFEKFYRGDKARSTENEGSGLGLSITKRIIELHEGILTIEKSGEFIKFKIKI